MIVVGLTGSIGMGKSTTAQLFAEEGAAVFDADAAVAELYGPGGAALAPIEAIFPGCTGPDGVDRAKLSAALQADPSGFQRLEAVVHPLVGQARKAFFAEAEKAGVEIVILDVPLLFETGQADAVDAVVVVSADEAVQKARVLQRPGMSEDKLAAILARQTPDSEKRARADFVITTDGGIEDARAQVRAVLTALKDAR
ncbi:MAG: dephospho-CoA kinase [Oceanicaulis sp.]